MPSAGRTSMPASGPAPLTSTFDATLRLAGSMVTIDLPSTRPTIQPAAWAPVAAKVVAASAPVSASTFIFPNMEVAPLKMIRVCRVEAYEEPPRCDQLRGRHDADAGHRRLLRAHHSRVR